MRVRHGVYIDAAGVFVGLVLAWLARLALLDRVSPDFQEFLLPWWNTVSSLGWSAQAYGFSNYNPPYLYLLTLTSQVVSDPLVGVKGLSFVFDIALAAAVAALVVDLGGSMMRGAVAAAVVLLLPTVVLNSAYLAQCDAVFAVFVVLSVRAQVRGQDLAAGVFAGLAVAVKLQGGFLLPLLLVRVLRGELAARALAGVVGAYAAALAPAWLLGRPVSELLGVYRDQVAWNSSLTLSGPTAYGWFPVSEEVAGELRPAAVCLGLALVLALVAGLRRLPRPLVGPDLVIAAVLVLVAVPWVLPSMHERYFYAADVLAVAVAVGGPRTLGLVPVLVQFASLVGYISYLTGGLDLRIPSAANLGAAVLLAAQLARWGQPAGRFPSALSSMVRDHGERSDLLGRAPSEEPAHGVVVLAGVVPDDAEGVSGGRRDGVPCADERCGSRGGGRCEGPAAGAVDAAR